MTEADVLTAIDDALDTGVAADGDALTRELQELALELRADAPEPTPAFRDSLDRRVAAGFPKRLSANPPWWRELMTPALAGALIILPLVLLVVFTGGGGSVNDGDSGGSSAGGGGGEAAVSADSAGGGAAEPARTPEGGFVP